jgi:hypothetical protein
MAYTLIKKNYNSQLSFSFRAPRFQSNTLLCFLLAFSFGSIQTLAEEASEVDSSAEAVNESTHSELNSKETQLSVTPPLALEADSDNISANEQNRLHTQLKQNPWMFLHPFIANYTVYSGSKELGSATRELTYQEGKWKIHRKGKLSKWFLSLKSDEYSSFVIVENKLLVDSFYTSSKVSFKDQKTINQHFDWANKIETGNKGKNKWELELANDTYDRMSHIIQLRADLLSNQSEFNYLVSYKGKRELYTYHNAGVEKIKTPFGVLDAIKMDRDDGNESNSIWFCPELNYFPVRISKFEQDEAEIVLELNKLEYTEPVFNKPAVK